MASFNGDYQGKKGYVRSERKGPPTGMRESDFINPLTKDSPETAIQTLVESGYPWNLLSTRFTEIDQRLEVTTNEYADIKESLSKVESKVDKIESDIKQNLLKDNDVRRIVREESVSLIGKIGGGVLGSMLALGGLLITSFADAVTRKFIIDNAPVIGLLTLIIGMVILFIAWRPKC